MSDQIEVLEVEDIEVFEILNNPIRLRIMRLLMEPTSIRTVAEALEVPPTRLYYHFNLLEEAGVIRVAETRKVGAMLQKLYQTVALSYRPSAKLIESDRSPADLARISAGVVLDGARLDAEEALTRQFSALSADDEFGSFSEGGLGRSISILTKEQAEEFYEKFQRFLEEELGAADDDEGIEYSFSFAFFPVAGSIEPPIV